MKKVILSLVLVSAMAVSFTSCKKAEEAPAEDVVEEVAPKTTEEAPAEDVVEEVAPETTEEVAPAPAN